MSFKSLCEELENKILEVYTNGVSLEEAERLAGEFLYAQLKVSEELKKSDLDSRMRKSGLKAVKAAIYMEAATKDQKKPSDVMLSALVDINEIVQGEQKSFDEAEAEKDNLERYYNIFKEAHTYFRQISRGKFE